MSIDISKAGIDRLVIHKIGNPSRAELLECSEEEVELTDESLREILCHYFLRGLKKEYFLQFKHPSDLAMNEIYAYATQFFTAPEESFMHVSKDVAKHLYNNTRHPQIKTGELYFVQFSGVLWEGEPIQAMGIFKSETKERFLKVYQQQQSYEVAADEGIDINKLDKACLIIDFRAAEGYRLLVHDATNKNEEARYWKEDFLQAQPVADEHFHTGQFISMCKTFVDDTLTAEFEIPKTARMRLLAESQKFISEQPEVSMRKFEEEVIQEPTIVEAFRKHKGKFEEQSDFQFPERFEVSDEAYRSNKKFFKHILKLDKNFHVYVHGNPDMLEKGYDDGRDLQYYKLYFREEQ